MDGMLGVDGACVYRKEMKITITLSKLTLFST